MAGRVVRAYGKGGEKGFDGAVTRLMMQMYLCNCDFSGKLKEPLKCQLQESSSSFGGTIPTG